MTRIRSGLSYANVMATIAVFLALGGGAYAAIHRGIAAPGAGYVEVARLTPERMAQ